MRIRQSAYIVAIFLAVCSCAPLSIVHFNDTHSHYEPERDVNFYQKGGVFERAVFIDSVRLARGEKNVLLVHAGDFSQGSSYFSVFEGEVETNLMNAIRYDCTTLGNHEFDNGVEALTERVKKMKTPVVCANLDLSSLELGKYVKPYCVIKKSGRRIGLIGVTANLSSNVKKEVSAQLTQLESVPEINRWAEYLRKNEHCSLVILLSHSGYREDVEMATELHGVDIIVGGHSHTFLEEMVNLEDADGKPIHIVQNGCWGREAGEILVY